MGFRAFQADQSLFIYKDDIIIIIYVDDILLFGKDKQLVATAKKQLCDIYEIRDISNLDIYLGMKIHCDRIKRILRFNQTDYIRKILDTYGFGDGTLYKTFMDSKAIYIMNADAQADEATVKDY
jgi:hypothetical protein